MGSVLSTAGSVLTGSWLAKPAGGIIDKGADALGLTNHYNAGNPYDFNYLHQQIDNQNQVYGQQQDLAKALQAQMNGQGPNPAQTQYLMNSQNNIANTQGLIASQRGLNPALATRMGANAGAYENQRASLGSALLQQQQQIAATQISKVFMVNCKLEIQITKTCTTRPKEVSRLLTPELRVKILQ
jgi:hypothetical protein